MAVRMSLLFSLAVLQLLTVHGQSRAVSKRDELWEIGQLPSDLPECVPLEHEYCNQLGISHTLSYNPARGSMPLGELIGEFRDFTELLDASNLCHPSIGRFLCFAYFPYCQQNNTVEQTSQQRESNSLGDIINRAVYPCSKLCEAIHCSSCTDYVRMRVSSGWAPHLQCGLVVPDNYGNEYPIYIAKTNDNVLCVDLPSGHEEPVCDPNKTPKEISSGEIEEFATEMLTTTNEPCPSVDCPKGGFRKNCNANTFKRNCYQFGEYISL